MSENKWKMKLMATAIKTIEEVLRRLRKNLDFSSEAKDSKKRCIVAIDYDNIRSNLRTDGKQFDFAEFLKILVNDFKFSIGDLRIYIPYDSYQGLPNNLNSLGYSIEICQKLHEFTSSEKREDKVDSVIAKIIQRFLPYEEITHVIILSHDFHANEVLVESFQQGKKVMVFADKDKMKVIFADVIEQLEIPIFPLPSKERKVFL